MLEDLKHRLEQARFADEIPDTNWEYGTNVAYLKALVGYWRDKYDWRAQERRLNQFDQFKTSIDGVDVHFILQRSKQRNATPLLLLNGWTASGLVWPVPIIERFERRFHVLRVDARGAGWSRGAPTPFTIADLADDAVTV